MNNGAFGWVHIDMCVECLLLCSIGVGGRTVCTGPNMSGARQKLEKVVQAACTAMLVLQIFYNIQAFLSNKTVPTELDQDLSDVDIPALIICHQEPWINIRLLKLLNRLFLIINITGMACRQISGPPHHHTQLQSLFHHKHTLVGNF